MDEMTTAFDEYLVRRAPYNDHIRAQGDLPWFEDPARRLAVCKRLGLPPATEPLEVRRALFERSGLGTGRNSSYTNRGENLV
ncbi:hypothetical protein [Mycobacteroides abscessus]|uniref:Uncharacterized protein n=1 Tax=Mycobacteroides abscessus 1948 TaxID=1299323 RepID=A0A829QNT1_9MYCO|nr:hypothetical protein MA6G0125R_4658 [Mycobacteroides abscessus 6G-0125-R]EIU51079.1 hypothetical protein MA6G0125S_0392 [Mycobacteroides abscessus 6G-0125-S]EIU61025.1 hypothetical protein MA6G0728S_0028 [Mycobacteroides abscessus 6G-0728-S]EIV02393.1 hypothetical protein MA6G0728R_0387 [Mycobacteroides abscessus 6G-0728-R]EUA64270.1 hypothetical protein I542_4438 [Mycobacteroides abscessus 1948]